MLNPRAVLNSVIELVPMDLVRGPFIMGSVLTHIHESEYHEPTWAPADLDVGCRTICQVDRVSTLLGKKFKIIRAPRYSNTTYHASVELLPGFNVNINYSGLENFSATDSIHKFSWATACAICTDGKNYLYHEHTLEDIKNKTLRLTSPGLINEINFYKSIGQFNYYQQVIRPGEQLSYDKYVARGYIDHDNAVRQELWREI
jgi:hypothetical protein